jgi:hypothetical protein
VQLLTGTACSYRFSYVHIARRFNYNATKKNSIKRILIIATCSDELSWLNKGNNLARWYRLGICELAIKVDICGFICVLSLKSLTTD